MALTAWLLPRAFTVLTIRYTGDRQHSPMIPTEFKSTINSQGAMNRTVGASFEEKSDRMDERASSPANRYLRHRMQMVPY